MIDERASSDGRFLLLYCIDLLGSSDEFKVVEFFILVV